MKKVVLILVLLIITFSISKADWVNKGQYFEMDSTYGAIKDFRISKDGQIWAVNAQNEILNFDFTTGKLIKRNKVEVDNNLKYFRVSKDASNTIFVSYKSPTYSDKFVDLRFQVYEHSSSNQILDTIINVDFNGLDDIQNFNFTDIDYSIKNQLLLLNFNYHAEFITGPAEYSSRNFNGFQILNVKQHIKLIDLDVPMESYQINLNNKLEDFYFIGRSYRSETSYSGDNNTSSSSSNYFQKYNINENKFENIFSFSSHSFHYHNGNGGSESGDPSYFQQLLHSQNDSLLYLIFHNRLNSNDTILYTYDKFTKKYIDSITIKENTRNYTYFKLDNKDFLHIINGNTYFIKLISNDLITLDSLYFPENVYNNQSFNNGEQTFVFFTDNKSKLNYFTTENLKDLPIGGFKTFTTLNNVNKVVRFFSFAFSKGSKYKWEVEPGIIISSNKNILDYTYEKPGIFDVKLTVIDSKGNEQVFEKKKYVRIINLIVADFSYKFDNQYKDNCYFQSKAIGETVFYDWDFGDGVKSNEKDPVHKYINYGDFKVRLIVGDSISRDTIFKTVSYFNNYIFNDISNRIILKDLIGMPKKTQAVEVYDDSLRFLQYNINISADYQTYSYLYSAVNFDIDINLTNNVNQDYPKYNNKAPFLKLFFVNKDKYVTLYDFLMLDKERVLCKYSSDYPIKSFNVGASEYKNIMYKDGIQNDKQFKMTNYKNRYYYVNYFNDSILYIDFKRLNRQPDFKKKIIFNKSSINNSFSMKYSIDKHFGLVSFNDYSHKYFIYNDLDTVFDFKELNFNKNIKIQNILQVDADNILIYGSEVLPDGYNLGTIIKFNTITNKTEIATFKQAYNIKSIEKISEISYLILPEVYGDPGYWVLDNNLNLKIDNRDKNIPKPIEFLRYIKNHVYMIYQLPDINNSINGAYNDNYTTYIVMDTLSDSITNITQQSETNFLIFPNPSSEKISLDLGGESVADLVVYDILGIEIMTLSNYANKSEIDISSLSIGSYTIQIQTNTGIISQRFVKY